MNQILWATYPDITGSTEANVDTAKLDKLPQGKWLIEYSFTAWSYDSTKAVELKYFILSQTATRTFPIASGQGVVGGLQTSLSIVERIIIDSTGEPAIFLRLSNFAGANFKNIILTATKIA
eukprot:TRINITY_DN23589_c0_g1_i1.p1 TRINITY_DN23589_c0_g1~~TRINITY_DN23589_c0_g1_i1.p1  ORF type:complete len:121 (-),score=16.59 TRINITY_DN23589_c0_g1_i1:63-425(-)